VWRLGGCTQRQKLHRLHRGCIQRLYPEAIPGGCTRRLHPEAVSGGCTRRLHPEAAPGGCTRRLYPADCTLQTVPCRLSPEALPGGCCCARPATHPLQHLLDPLSPLPSLVSRFASPRICNSEHFEHASLNRAERKLYAYELWKLHVVNAQHGERRSWGEIEIVLDVLACRVLRRPCEL